MCDMPNLATIPAQQLLLPDWLISSATEVPLQYTGLLVEGTQIKDVGSSVELRTRYPNATCVELPGKALSAGFVDSHRHCYGVLAHGIPAESAPEDFWAFLNDFWWGRIEDRLDHDMLRAAMNLACFDMINSGITTFFDCLEAPNAIPGGLHVQAEVVQRWGLRGMLCFEATQRVSDENGELGLRENVDFIRACTPALATEPPPLLLGALCHHTTFTCNDDFIRRAHALAREHHALLHFHCAEGTYEPEQCLQRYGQRTIEHYASLGVLDETTMASQCVQLSPREVEIVGAHSIKVTTMPLSNCEVGGGFAPVPELRRAGATVGLGTDGYVANFFASLRGAFLLHKARLLDPRVMPARTVWQMATEEGARSMGLANVGALRPGASADLIAIDLDVPTPVTAHNLLDQLILWRDASHVHSVMCAGRWLKRDHAVLHADPVELQTKTREAAARLWYG
jgi:cytosine/adenosine deaminase-related metal-dependent hydrolase